MPRKTHEEALKTKQLIIDVGLKLFSTRGFENTSLADIASEANVTRGAIYWHFKDKEDLLFEICNIIDRQKLGLDILEKAGDPNTQEPMKIFRKWLIGFKNDEAVRFFNSALSKYLGSVIKGADVPNSIKSRITLICDRWEGLISRAFDNAMEKGELPLSFDKRLAGCMTNIFITGYIDVLNTNRNNSIVADFPDLVDNFVRTLERVEAIN